MFEQEDPNRGGEQLGGPPKTGRGEATPSPQSAELRQRPGAPPARPPAAVVVPEWSHQPRVSRRGILRAGFWTSLGALIAGGAAGGVDLLYPRQAASFGGKIAVGDVSQFPPGSKTAIEKARLWLVHLTEEQGGPGLLALWWKCPHLGCTVPWRQNFIWPDPTSGAPKQGWFRCPCHGSTYTDAGIRVYGPAPRPLDTMELTVKDGVITVDTGKITPGRSDNPERAVRL